MWRHMLRTFLPFACVLMQVFAGSTGEGRQDIRLPRTFIPYHYILEFQPDIYQLREADFNVKGSVTIHMTCREATDKVVLHAQKMVISNSSLVFGELDGDHSGWVSHWSENTEHNFFIVHLNKRTIPGEDYYLSVNYVYQLKVSLRGMYYSSYYGEHGTIRHMVATNMAPVYARRAFPCFDEPGLKSTFNITVLRKSSHTALSNMPQLDSKVRADGWIVDRFLRTPNMSTYLVAVVVTDYKYTEIVTNRGVYIRVWSKERELEKTKYALNISKTVLEYAENYFGFNYNLPKLDQIAVPDFMYSGMENFGLVIYFESSLYTYKNDSTNKQNVVYTVSHEIAHQWFGDIITMDWWDDLWLKEAFAEYFGRLMAKIGDRDFKLGEHTMNRHRRAVRKDSYRLSQPVVLPENRIQSNADIQRAYDPYILYSKGGIVMEMLQFALGEDTFMRGIKHYIRKNAFKAVTRHDFFHAMQSVVDMFKDRNGRVISVDAFFSTWLNQKGYPVVKVIRDGDTVILKQDRFLIGFSNYETKQWEGNFTSPFGYKWEIPFNMRTNKDSVSISEDDIIWMHKTDVTLNMNLNDRENTWIIGNPGMLGFYIVNYDDDNWKLMADMLDNDIEAFPYWTRIQLLENAIRLCRGGLLKVERVFDLARYLTHEREYYPWFIFMDDAAYIRSMLIFSPTFSELKRYMARLIKPNYDIAIREFILKKENVSTTHQSTIHHACRYEYWPCISQAVRQFIRWGYNLTGVPLEMKRTIVCAVVAHGPPRMYDSFLSIYLNELEKATVIVNGTRDVRGHAKFIDSPHLYGLACVKNPATLKRLLDYAFSPNTSMTREISCQILDLVARNPLGTAMALDAFFDHWGYFKNSQAIHVIRLFTNILNRRDYLRATQLFRNSRPLSVEVTIAVDILIDSIKENIKWLERNEESVTEWLEDFNRENTDWRVSRVNSGRIRR